MNNTLDNFQPDNKVFWQLLTAVLCLVFCILYTAYRLRDQGGLNWPDWTILGALSLPVTSMFRKMLKERNAQ